MLVDEGLATALEALAETGAVPLTLESVPDQRFAAPVEAAAYFLVAEVVRRGSADGVTVRAGRSDGLLRIEIDSEAALDENLVDVEDRIGALDGRLTVLPARPGHTTICAELPCGS